MRLLLGTTNRGKQIELREGLCDLAIDIVTPQDLRITGVPEEHGETFRENALQKARFYYEASGGIPTLADDSGIVVEALRNELGIHTRRWGAGPEASDHHWVTFFLERMEREANKRARFLCVLCFIDAHKREHCFEGTCDGSITQTLEASYLPGLPISACFRPDGCEKVYSALSIEEKNRVSHRGKAITTYHSFLKKVV